MLKRYKNALFEAIREAGLSQTYFTGEEEAEGGFRGFRIRCRGTNLSFIVQNLGEDLHTFECAFSRYVPSDPDPVFELHPGVGYTNFDSILPLFQRWLTGEVKTAIEEELLPDLWAQVSHPPAVLNSEASGNREEFTREEREQIRLALHKFHLSVSKTFFPSEHEQAVVDEHIAYLVNAVDRLNRFDWKSVAMNTLISMTIALSLDSEKGRILYGLFEQAFASIRHLLAG